MSGFPGLSRVIMWVGGFGSLTNALVSMECSVASRVGFDRVGRLFYLGECETLMGGDLNAVSCVS